MYEDIIQKEVHVHVQACISSIASTRFGLHCTCTCTPLTLLST